VFLTHTYAPDENFLLVQLRLLLLFTPVTIQLSSAGCLASLCLSQPLNFLIWLSPHHLVTLSNILILLPPDDFCQQ